jgi:gliding motility-associated-like protein
LNKRKHIAFILFCIAGFLFSNVSAFSQATISAPTIECIAVDSSGAATVTWKVPGNLNNTFVSYNVDTSMSSNSGFALGSTVTTSTLNWTYIKNLGANSSPVYFYGYTNTTKGLSDTCSTIESIFLGVTALSGSTIALLNWNAMCTPALPGFNGWYKIYREYPQYVWTLLDSTKALIYKDTIDICDANLNYKIVTDNSFGCQSVSNIAGGHFFDKTGPNLVVMDTVSVGPTGNVEISWSISSSKDTKEYYIYEFIKNTWTIIDSVQGRDSTFFNFTKGSPGTGTECFCVAGVDSCHNVGPLSDDQCTLYLQQANDQCAHENTLNWNAYVNLIPAVGKYNIYVSVAGGKFQLLASTNSKTVTYVDTGLNKPETLCYYVQVIDSSKPTVTASSNIICYQVTTPPPPGFAYLRSATVINNSTQNQVNFYFDTGAQTSLYIVKRYDVPGGNQTQVGTVPATTSLFYSLIDPSANPNVQSYTYKVYSQDNCDYITDSTNIGQTMFLTAVGDNTGKNTLNWNDYTLWNKGVSKYNIYRDEDDGAFSQIASIPGTGGSQTFTDDVSAIITGQGIFGYYVEAVEQGPNGYGFIDTSVSNIAKAYQDPRMYIPNAFNPKGINKVFMPVGVFVDLQNYDFTIFDRWGELLFETNDVTVGWDGTYHGKLVEEGVYIYHIQYTSGKGEYFNQRGWVMMLK